MKNEIDKVYTMTRKEYYLSQGLSGSEIDRPDDLVNDAFIQHVQGLKNLMEQLIQNSKNGINCTFIGNKQDRVGLETLMIK